MANTIILTGIKPTGEPHLGNFVGAIEPALEMAKKYKNEKKFFFIADYHALTTIKDPQEMAHYRQSVAATWLSFFKKSENCFFYFQSQVPEIFELYWILSCFCPKGLLNRAHAYKALTAKNTLNNHDPDRQINHGLFSYPVLMAADILLFKANLIPVGQDQKQHVEIAVEIVKSLNHKLKKPIPIPEPLIDHENKVVIGTDGEKMSKNYNNTLPLFASRNELKKKIGKIRTDSKPLGEPLDYNNCNVFKLFSYISSKKQQSDLKQKYQSGSIGYGHAKNELLEAYETYFEDAKQQYNSYLSNGIGLNDIISGYSKEVASIAATNLREIKRSLGVLK